MVSAMSATSNDGWRILSRRPTVRRKQRPHTHARRHGPASDPHMLADTTLRALTLARRGRMRDARSAASAIPKVLRCFSDDGADEPELLVLHRRFADALYDMAELEKSKAGDTLKPSRRAKVQRHHTAVRQEGRRVELGTFYDEHGQPIQGLDAIVHALRDFWSPVFAPRPFDEEVAGQFLSHVQRLPVPRDWTWPAGRTRSIAEAASGSTSGLDGLGKSFWASTPQAYHDTLDAVATAAQAGRPLPSELHSTRSWPNRARSAPPRARIEPSLSQVRERSSSP